MKQWLMELAASLLTVVGVVFIAESRSVEAGGFVPLAIGSAVLAVAVRLAIDCGKRGGR